ncbi:M16 family metallopeptidase [Chitinimonas sp.]|uniref:M16 family metallopeptidase n=1 Tax=Chitinimonas sp. TaxID=1934313 RepID=UPI0035AE3E47
MHPHLFKQLAKPMLALLFAGKALAATAAIQAESSLEGVSSYRLGNGLQVLLVPDDSQTNTLVTVNYFVGSRDEPHGSSGSAHLLEHMLFLGTPKVPSPRDEFRRRGMNQNATTFSDRTAYFESFAANSPCSKPAGATVCMDNLEWALMMEADRMVNASVSKDSLAKEMTVVRNELERGENSPGNVLYQRLLASAYRYNKYREPVIGNRSDVESATPESLRALYQRFYRPDNAALTIAGAFDSAKALAWVQQYFGPLAKPATAIARQHSIEPAQDGERSVTLRRPGDLPFLIADYHVPSCLHPDYAPLAVLAYVLANGNDGRIQKQLVDTKQVLGGGANMDCLIDPGLFQVSVTLPKDAKLAESEASLLKLVETDLLDSIKDEQIERAVSAYASSSRQAMLQPFTLSGMVGSGAAQGDWRLPFYLRDQLESVKPADVRRVAQRYLLPANRTLGRFIPSERSSEVSIPAAPDVASLLAHYQGRAAASEGEKFEASIAHIASRVQTGQFANGLHYALLPRKMRGEQVYLRLKARFGDVESLFGKEVVGDALNGLLGQASQSHSKVAVSTILDQLHAGTEISADAQGFSAVLKAERQQLDPALTLLAELLRSPRFDATDFDTAKLRKLEGLAATRSSSDPSVLASPALSKHFAGNWPRGDLRHLLSPDEEQQDVQALTLQGIESFYQQYYGIGEGELVVVGDFDSKAMLPKLEQMFGSWHGKQAFRHASTPFVAVAPGYYRINTPDRANAVYSARANLPIGYDHADRLAANVANALLGAGDKSRLFQRIRTQEGLSYGIQSNVSFGRQDDWGIWRISASFAPENRERIGILVKEEIERARKDGFTQQELDDIRTGWLQNMQTRLGSPSYQLDLLERSLRWNEALSRDEEEIAALKRLTVKDVNEALHKYFDPALLTIVVVGNFSGGNSIAQ